MDALVVWRKIYNKRNQNNLRSLLESADVKLNEYRPTCRS